MPSKMGDEIIYPFNGSTTEVREWISNFMTHSIKILSIIHAGFKKLIHVSKRGPRSQRLRPCWGWNFFICAWEELWRNQRMTHLCNYMASLGHNEFNSLWPGDAIWQQGTMSTLAQVMACCLTAPSHYLNQCWLISKVPWHSSEGIIMRRYQSVKQDWKLQFKMVSRSPRVQWVKPWYINECHNFRTALKCDSFNNFTTPYHLSGPSKKMVSILPDLGLSGFGYLVLHMYIPMVQSSTSICRNPSSPRCSDAAATCWQQQDDGCHTRFG